MMLVYASSENNHQKHGQYLDAMDRGGLNMPTDNICRRSIFCFIVFNAIKEKVYRRFFRVLCMIISKYYDETEKRHELILSNILLKN